MDFIFIYVVLEALVCVNSIFLKIYSLYRCWKKIIRAKVCLKLSLEALRFDTLLGWDFCHFMLDLIFRSNLNWIWGIWLCCLKIYCMEIKDLAVLFQLQSMLYLVIWCLCKSIVLSGILWFLVVLSSMISLRLEFWTCYESFYLLF